jgi:Nickel responsive protein SCO4226-like
MKSCGGSVSDIQWVESYIAGDELFCVYLAVNEELICKHSEINGFPATKIHKLDRKIDPTLASSSVVGPIPVGHTP